MKKLVILSAAALVAAACSVESIESAVSGSEEGFVLKVNVPTTKTVFDGTDYTVEWEEGDALGVYVVADGGEGTLYKFDKAADANSFACADFAPAEGVSYSYYVVYPYNSEFSVTEGKSSAVINIANGAGTDADIDTPLYGMATATGTDSPTVALSHAAAVVKVNISNQSSSALAVSSIALTSADLALTGTYSVDFTTGALTASETSTTASVTLSGASVAPSATETYYIACAPFADGSFTVNVNNGALTSAKTGLTFEAGKVYGTTMVQAGYTLSGTALPAGATAEVYQTLENANVYAWRAELQAGELNIATPEGYVTASDKTFGKATAYTVEETTSAWTIADAGTYRIVIDSANKTVTVYDPTTDLKNTTVSYNNTVDKVNPYAQEVTTLWMWGGFNSFSTESGMKTGFNSKYTLKQSLANPNVFVYKGEVLPRLGANDANNRNTYKTGFIKFLVSNIENNVYAYGSTADAKRNDHSGYLENIELGTSYTLVAGQGDNRYAYFIIPKNTNYVEVDIENLTVVFDNK